VGISSKNGSWKRGAKRTTIQIECPHIIKTLLVNLATEDEEIGTNQSHGMVITTAGPRTIDHDAGPLSRYWNARSSDQLERVLTSKDRHAEVEKIK